MHTIQLETRTFQIPKPNNIPQNIKSIMSELAKGLPLITSFVGFFYLRKIRAKVLRLYNEAISNENLGEEAFFDFMESVFIDSLYGLKAQYENKPFLRPFLIPPSSKLAEKVLEITASLIAPKEFDKELKEELKTVAREAFQSFLAKEEISKDKQLQEQIILRLKNIAEQATYESK